MLLQSTIECSQEQAGMCLPCISNKAVRHVLVYACSQNEQDADRTEQELLYCNCHAFVAVYNSQHDKKVPTLSRFSNISTCLCNAWLSAVISCSLCLNSRICPSASSLDSSASVTRSIYLAFASERCPICNAIESNVFDWLMQKPAERVLACLQHQLVTVPCML